MQHLGLINHATFVCDEEVWCKRPRHTLTSERPEARKDKFIYLCNAFMHFFTSANSSLKGEQPFVYQHL